MKSGRVRERLVALFVTGVVLLNYPLLNLFGGHALVLGVPLLYWYLFGCWIAIIALLAFVMERKAVDNDPANSGGE